MKNKTFILMLFALLLQSGATFGMRTGEYAKQIEDTQATQELINTLRDEVNISELPTWQITELLGLVVTTLKNEKDTNAQINLIDALGEVLYNFKQKDVVSKAKKMLEAYPQLHFLVRSLPIFTESLFANSPDFGLMVKAPELLEHALKLIKDATANEMWSPDDSCRWYDDNFLDWTDENPAVVKEYVNAGYQLADLMLYCALMQAGIVDEHLASMPENNTRRNRDTDIKIVSALIGMGICERAPQIIADYKNWAPFKQSKLISFLDWILTPLAQSIIANGLSKHYPLYQAFERPNEILWFTD